MEDRSRAQHPRRRSLHPIHRLRPRRRRARRGGVQDGGRYRRRPRHCVGDATKDYRSLTVPTDGIQVLATNDARYGKILAGPEYLDWNTSSLVRLLTATGAAANNGTKANAALTADLCGDWREEVIWRAADNTSLRIYSTTIPATNRIYTLMHDPQYRLAIAWQNVGYNQPPHPSFYLGEGMSDPPRPRIVHRDTEAPAFKTLTPSATRRPARRGSDSADHRCLERPSG